VAGFIGSPPMNFLPASLHDGQVQLPFLSYALDPALAKRIGEEDLLIAGIRPEQFEVASMVDDRVKGDGITFTVQVDVTEWLGNSQYAYVPFEAPEQIRTQLAELEKELDSEQMRTQMIVSVDPASRVTDGEKVELWIDPRKIILFNPHTGDNLSLPVNDQGQDQHQPAPAETGVTGGSGAG
jgi:multiple sugar transport system ATP-binding protein